MIRPVRGADVGAAENLRGGARQRISRAKWKRSSCSTTPTIRAIRSRKRAIADHQARGGHGKAEIILAGTPPHGVTGKLHAMMVGEARARHELVAFSDSDTRPDRDVLRATVETLLTTPRAGCAFAPVVAHQPAVNAGDVGYATMLNMWYGASVATVSGKSGDLPFIMGQLMVFRRHALRDIGGVACARGELVDDMAIGRASPRRGWRNVMAPHPLHVATGGMSYAEFLKLSRRWMLFGRNGLPFEFTKPMWLRGVEFWLGMLTLALAFGTQHWLAALAPARGARVHRASMLRINKQFGGAPVGCATCGRCSRCRWWRRRSSPTGSSTRGSTGAAAPTTWTCTRGWPERGVLNQKLASIRASATSPAASLLLTALGARGLLNQDTGRSRTRRAGSTGARGAAAPRARG